MKENLETLAMILNAMVPTNVFVDVEETWRDFGAGIKWETLICHRSYITPKGTPGDSTYQMLYPIDMDKIKIADTLVDFMEIANDLLDRQHDLIFK